MSPPTSPYTADSPSRSITRCPRLAPSARSIAIDWRRDATAMFMVLNTRNAAMTSEISDTSSVASRVTKVAVSICLARNAGSTTTARPSTIRLISLRSCAVGTPSRGTMRIESRPACGREPLRQIQIGEHEAAAVERVAAGDVEHGDGYPVDGGLLVLTSPVPGRRSPRRPTAPD